METKNLVRLKTGAFIFVLSLIIFLSNADVLAQQHGDLIRAQGETKIYLIQSGQRRAIASEEVFRQMGFKMEDVKELDPQTVTSIPEGPPLWSKEVIALYPDGTLIRLKGKVQTYVIRGGRKCYIPDPETFQAQGFQWDQVIEVDQPTFNKIPTGIPLASVKPPYQYGAPGMPPTGSPGLPPSAYPPGTYPPGSYPPPAAYPPSGSPPPYPYPPSPGQPAPSYPPPSYPTPSQPPPGSPYPSAPPKPSSFLHPRTASFLNASSTDEIVFKANVMATGNHRSGNLKSEISYSLNRSCVWLPRG